MKMGNNNNNKKYRISHAYDCHEDKYFHVICSSQNIIYANCYFDRSQFNAHYCCHFRILVVVTIVF
jgi:hypothetical protein